MPSFFLRPLEQFIKILECPKDKGPLQKKKRKGNNGLKRKRERYTWSKLFFRARLKALYTIKSKLIETPWFI